MGDIAKASEYSILAAKHDEQRLAFEGAARHYRRALRALELRPKETVLQRDVLLQLASAERAAGRIDQAERAEQRASELAERIGAAADRAPGTEQAEESNVAITTLGGFRIVRDGKRVAEGEWQSKKARDLLKLLVARRGRPVPRGALMEAMWPEEDPAKLPNRLAVALTTVRSILDPARRFPPDHFLRADRGSVSLELNHIDLDLERFMTRAEAGHGFLRAGKTKEAIGELSAAEAMYRGDFLAEDPYEDWAIPAREAARAAYAGVAHALAEDALSRGEDDTSVGLYLGVLELDSYDERAHLGLVTAFASAGRHGEARRAYDSYAARMDEMGVKPSPYPG
jgi:DNA-binding SARP family transcriptional activator